MLAATQSHATLPDGDVEPNPFFDRCTFFLTVPPQGARVNVTVYDIAGRHVRTLMPQDGGVELIFLGPGVYELPWDGQTDAGRSVVPGVYIAVLSTERGISRAVKAIKL